jgi:hypothetical protein
MRAALATQPGSPDAANEDWAGVLAPGLAVVLDGLSAPDGTGTGCRHGTPWYVSQLGPDSSPSPPTQPVAWPMPWPRPSGRLPACIPAAT